MTYTCELQPDEPNRNNLLVAECAFGADLFARNEWVDGYGLAELPSLRFEQSLCFVVLVRTCQYLGVELQSPP